MKQKLENQLLEDFSWLETRDNSYMEEKLGFCVAMECDDGWYDLIHDLCQDIQNYCNTNNVNTDNLRLLQVKEKFGLLRFYHILDKNNDAVYLDGIEDIVIKYEKLSGHICEICGDNGETQVYHGWLKTLCQKHKIKE